MGLAWGASPLLSLIDLMVLVALSFTIINLSSAIGAQVNTIYDHELDSRDDRKKSLVRALSDFGQRRVKRLLLAEFLFALSLVSLLLVITGKPILLFMWVAGISLGYLYSAPPLRIKARSWLAPFTLILVLAIFPVLFEYYIFSSVLKPLFLVSLAGLAMTVYGVIIPTEIRDYFVDKAMEIETMTVRLGLVKASLLSILLLSGGGIFVGAAFFLELAYSFRSAWGFSVLTLAVADYIALRRFRKLYCLSKEYASSRDQGSIEKDIVSLSAHNPRWIMLVTQTYSLLSIILLMSRFLP